MDKTVSLSAIVLAGGQSSRMGRDKALITLQGVPLLRQVCEVALNCASPVYVVTSWPERYQDILPDACRVIQEVPLPGETEPHGPLVAFAQGLAHVETDWVLLLACDLPQLQVKVLQGWVTGLEKTVARGDRTATATSKRLGTLVRFLPTPVPANTYYIYQRGRAIVSGLVGATSSTGTASK
jgi:molybdopterin-guanine dinucleotide biosynthesis protein A